MKKENAINFLLYSLLGVTLNSKEDELLEVAINRAYLDSCRVFSVRGTDEYKDKIHKEAIDKIKQAIQKGLDKGETYDNWHANLCGELIKVYSGKTRKDRPFTYGIAQKWVNMTMKYLSVMKSIFAEYGHEDKLKIWVFIDKNENSFHMPVDSFILEALSDVFEVALEKAELPEDEKKNMPLLQKDGGYGKYSDSKTKPWSNYTKDDYAQLQGNLKIVTETFSNWANKLEKDEKHDWGKELETCSESPLDWESENWIRISDERKEKERIKKERRSQN